ncbi:MAG: alpha-glucan family phosphorylase [Ferruginibacter sp.]|nr:alpha-glucan family phosphorylase [Ferruginibacter sp.]
MGKDKISKNHLYGFLSSDKEGINELVELALNLRWSWNHATDGLWQQLNAALWQLTHNPWIVLQATSQSQIESKLADASFRKKMNELVELREHVISKPAWFQQTYPAAPLTCVAYFSMEFMLSEALPIYVGGLGNVAGDQLKSASDLGVPVVAIGLLYQQGYFRQQIDKYGNQQAMFPYNDPGQLPVAPLRLPNGEWLRLQVSLAGQTVWLRTWQVQVGRVKLYLLDSNDVVNLPAHREITSELYGGDSTMRIKQEILLGIGGWKLLQAMDIKPEVCHMNEGHAAFLILERANSSMKENDISFEAALAVTRAGNLFTTHTAVAAGFDHFSPDLMWQFFSAYAKDELKIDFNALMALGRQDANNYSESFNMAYLAVRGSSAVNGVSKLHRKVSQHLFEQLFPRWAKEEISIGSVTNGVHTPSWDAEFADKVWTDACGKERWNGGLEKVAKDISTVSDEILWQLRNVSRNDLVNYTRTRFESQLTVAGFSNETIAIAKQVFNPDTLTLGFARRFVDYKRPDLLLHDQERFIRILTNKEHPLQLVIAGKAPPFDENGKGLIRGWIEFIQRNNLYKHVVFLSDYDMLLAEKLVQGVDVWVNTPRRPWEASGTSGMKVLVNGGINLSELDGWWAEAYTPEVGWALGDGNEHGDDPAWDAAEAEALYDLLEKEVVPEFYKRNEKGIPERWVERMRKSMTTLTALFSANRSVREYTENFYLPAAKNYIKRASEKGAAGVRIINTRAELKSKWGNIKFGGMQIENIENGYEFHLPVFLNHIDPGKVLVQLFAEGIGTAAPTIIKMEANAAINKEEEKSYHAKVLSERPAADFTARLISNYEGVLVPLEDNLILWQH